jgi:hypothetical protein
MGGRFKKSPPAISVLLAALWGLEVTGAKPP